MKIFDKRVSSRLNRLIVTDLMRAVDIEEEAILSNMATLESHWAYERIGKDNSELLHHVFDVLGFVSTTKNRLSRTES